MRLRQLWLLGGDGSPNRAGIRYYGEITGAASMPSFDQLLKQSQQGDKAAVEALTKMTFNIGKGIRS